MVGVLCAAVLCLIPVAHSYGWFSRSPIEDDGGVLGNPDLVVSEAIFAGESAARHLEGSIWNRSANRYSDVRVVFTTRAMDGALLAPVTAIVAEIGPGATKSFQSAPVPLQTTRYYVRDISGTPR